MFFFFSVLTSGSSCPLCCRGSWGWKRPLENCWSNLLYSSSVSKISLSRTLKMTKDAEPITSVGNHPHVSFIVVAFPLLSQLLPPWTIYTVLSALASSNIFTSASSGPAHSKELWAKPEQGVIPPQDNIPRKIFFLVQLECMLWPARKQNLFYKPWELRINKTFLNQLYREEWALN